MAGLLNEQITFYSNVPKPSLYSFPLSSFSQLFENTFLTVIR